MDDVAAMQKFKADLSAIHGGSGEHTIADLDRVLQLHSELFSDALSRQALRPYTVWVDTVAVLLQGFLAHVRNGNSAAYSTSICGLTFQFAVPDDPASARHALQTSQTLNWQMAREFGALEREIGSRIDVRVLPDGVPTRLYRDTGYCIIPCGETYQLFEIEPPQPNIASLLISTPQGIFMGGTIAPNTGVHFTHRRVLYADRFENVIVETRDYLRRDTETLAFAMRTANYPLLETAVPVVSEKYTSRLGKDDRQIRR